MPVKKKTTPKNDEVQTLREALAFYAAPTNWERGLEGTQGRRCYGGKKAQKPSPSAAELDGGAVARDALG